MGAALGWGGGRALTPAADGAGPRSRGEGLGQISPRSWAVAACLAAWVQPRMRGFLVWASVFPSVKWGRMVLASVRCSVPCLS